MTDTCCTHNCDQGRTCPLRQDRSTQPNYADQKTQMPPAVAGIVQTLRILRTVFAGVGATFLVGMGCVWVWYLR